MTSFVPLIRLPLSAKPNVSLMAMGIHGPRVTERYSSGLWWLHFYRYSGALRIMGATLPLRPCCVTIIPPGTEMEYDFPERSSHLCAHFVLPGDPATATEMPLFMDLGDQFPAIYNQFEEALACFNSNPTRAEVRLWDILWRLAEPHPKKDLWIHHRPGPVQQAQEIIELRLEGMIGVADLAAEVGVSHNHLIRLFRKSTGQTVIGYIRRRRVERAEHLLRNTTLPIKTIAAQVGFEEPRMLNKLMHDYLGVSPSEARKPPASNPSGARAPGSYLATPKRWGL